MLPSSIQKTLMSKKYLIFTILAALLIFCIGLYGISLATRKVENFSMFGTCGEGSEATVCSGDKPFCKVTEKALPTDTLDQVLTFNTEGQYVEIVPNSTGSVELSQVAVYDSNGVNVALGKPVTASCISPTITIGLPTTDDDQVVVVPRVFARYVRVRPGLQSDGHIDMTQLMVLNESMNNLAKGKRVDVTSTHGQHAAASMITNDTTLKPQSGIRCWSSNADSSSGKMTEFLEIDLGAPTRIHSIRYIGRLKADYTSDQQRERNRPRIELSSYSARSSPETVNNSVTVDGTLTARVDLSKVCLMSGPSPVWRVNLGQSYKIAKIRYIGYNSGTGFYDASKNTITPPDRNTGLRFRIKNDVNETTTLGTCIAAVDISGMTLTYPPDATNDERKILKGIVKPYITLGIDLTKVMCIYRTIKKDTSSKELHTKLTMPVASGGCGLTDQQVAKSYAKMKFNNISFIHNGWVITGSWSSPGNTITLTSGLMPEIGMKIGKVTTSNPNVSWSMSDSDITAVDLGRDGKNFTISKTMTEPSGKDVKIKLIGLDRVDYDAQTKLLYSDALSRVKGINNLDDIDFDKPTCIKDYIKNNTMNKKILNVVDPTDGMGGPIDPALAASNKAIVDGDTMKTQESDPIQALTDVFTRVLLPAVSDPNSGYTGVNTENAALANNSWSTDVVGMLEGTPPVPTPTSTTLVATNVTDAEVESAPTTFSSYRTTVSRDDMDAAAAAVAINYSGGDGTNTQGKEAYFVGGQFSSKEQAEQVCRTANAELANPIQLLNAWRRGAQWCEPGWVAMTFEQANSEKTRIEGLKTLWNASGGYGKQLGDYNTLRKNTIDALKTASVKSANPDPREMRYFENKVQELIFYDASGEGIWVKIAGENETKNPFTLLNQYPWMGTSATVRYGESFAWIEMTVPSSRLVTANVATFGGAAAATAQALVDRLQNQLNAANGYVERTVIQLQLDVARGQLASTNADPRPGVAKEMQLKIKSPPIPSAIRNSNYTSLDDINKDLESIEKILGGLSANQFKAYKQFPSQQIQTISRTMYNKETVKMQCTQEEEPKCPAPFTPQQIYDRRLQADRAPNQIEKDKLRNFESYEVIKKGPWNSRAQCVRPCNSYGPIGKAPTELELTNLGAGSYANPMLSMGMNMFNDNSDIAMGKNHEYDPTKCSVINRSNRFAFIYNLYFGRPVDKLWYVPISRTRDSVDPESSSIKQKDCVCPTNYAAPSGTRTTYEGDTSKIPKICAFTGTCEAGYSPYKNSTITCIKDTCDEGFYAVGEKCASNQFRACGVESKVVDKSSNTTAGAVCYGKKTSNRMSTIQIYDTPLQGTTTYSGPITKAISKTGRYVRIWPAIKIAKAVTLNQNGQGTTSTRSNTAGVTVDMTVNMVGTTGGNSVTPTRDCPAGSDAVTVTDVAGNASFYCRPRQCADSGYVVKNQLCVYLSWLALSQVVVKDKAGNNVSQGKNTYAFPPQSSSSPVQTRPQNLVNGTTRVLNSLDTNNGWLSDEYYDGDTDTFWEVDLGADIEIGTIDIYPNNYRNSQGGNYPYDSPGMSKTAIYDQMTGIRIEISKSPRPLPFGTRDNKVVWNDSAAFKQLDCVDGFYKKDCGDGKGVQCITEGLGCPGDCPAGLNRSTADNADSPPVGTCVLNIYSLYDMQRLARSQVVKSDYYTVDGSMDYKGFNAALNTATNKTNEDYCTLIKARYAGVKRMSEYQTKLNELLGLMDPIGLASCVPSLSPEQLKRFMEVIGEDLGNDIKNVFVDTIGGAFVTVGNTIETGLNNFGNDVKRFLGL